MSPAVSPRKRRAKQHTARTAVSTELVPIRTRYSPDLSPQNTRASLEIEAARARRNQRETIKLLQEEQKQKDLERNIRIAQKQLAKRGIERKGKTARFDETTIEMDTGLFGKEKPVISLRDFETEIPEHRDSVKVMLDRYGYLLRILFKKYMGKAYTAKLPKKSTFD